MILETSRVYIRHWIPAEWDLFRPIAANPEVMKYIGNGQPWSDAHIQQFVKGAAEVGPVRGWVLWPVFLKENDELIGICGFGDHAPKLWDMGGEIDIGWWLKPEYWGRGLATEMGSSMMAYGFERLGFKRVISIAHKQNVASINVMRKLQMSFLKEVQKETVSVVIYQKAALGFAIEKRD